MLLKQGVVKILDYEMESGGLISNTAVRLTFMLQTIQKLHTHYTHLYYVLYITAFYIFDFPQVFVCVHVLYFLAS